MESYAGVDLASDKHDVLVADAAGEKLLAATFAHDEKGLRSLCRQLLRLKVVLVAVERPDRLLVERLLDAGLRVLALHPNQVAAAPDRFRVSGGKSDRFDAFLLCELARTDHHRFRVLAPDSDQTIASDSSDSPSTVRGLGRLTGIRRPPSVTPVLVAVTDRRALRVGLPFGPTTSSTSCSTSSRSTPTPTSTDSASNSSLAASKSRSTFLPGRASPIPLLVRRLLEHATAHATHRVLASPGLDGHGHRARRPHDGRVARNALR